MFGVLGPLQVTGTDGAEIVVAGQRQRRLLSSLLLHRGSVVSADRLCEMVWGAQTPVDPAALQSLVFRLRQRVPGLALDHRAPGYVLGVDDEHVDAARFERSVLAAVAARAEDPVGSLALLDSALDLWRGRPFDDLIDADDARATIDRLAEIRHRAREERFELLLDAGAAADVIADLEGFVLGEPLRERPRHLLMSAYAALGRRAEALRVYDAYRRQLADELGVSPSPGLRRRHDDLLAADDADPDLALEIEDRPDGEGCSEVGSGGGSARSHDAAAPGATLMPTGTRRASVRRPASSFVGRDDLVVDVVAALSAGRLVTLIGPGGVGKTRLATEVVHRLDGSGIDGVIFCDLSTVADGSLATDSTATDRSVVDVVMGAAGVERRSTLPDIDRLVDVLRHERCCVVLDNCEHVVDQAAAVAERLVELTRHAVVLATSRERLAIDGERLVVVPPLPHVGGVESPAMRLFVDRMVAVTGRPPEQDELACIDELATRLDGLPLALELAAARMQTLTAREVLAGVDDSIAVLRGGRRTVERHRSVDAALRWSYDLLDDPARATLRAASAFTAPFGADDVAAVMAADPSIVLESLSVLIERSMARREGRAISLLHVVRSFAREQATVDERDALSRAVALRMRDVAAELHADLRRSHDSAPIDAYLARVADFRHAIVHSLGTGDVDTALRIVGSLRDLALNSSSFEVERWAEDAAAAGVLAGHPSSVDGYAIAAIAAWKRGSLTDMRRLIALAEGLVERAGSGATYELLGAQATEDLAHGDLDRGIERLHQALRLPGIAADPISSAETMGTLVICMAYGHHPDVVEVSDAMVADPTHDRAAIAMAWCQYAAGECRLDIDPIAARRHLVDALGHARAGGSTFIEGIAGASLASLDVRSDRLAEAIESYRWLVPLWMRAGLESPFWTGMRAVAELLMRAGDSIAAIRILGAVTTPGAGHDVFGADAARLDLMRAELAAAVGPATFEEAFGEGAVMDEAAAAREAAAAFDRVITGAAR